MRTRNFLECLLLGLMWGPSYLFIKLAVEEIPPSMIVTGRVSLAALILLFLVKGRGLSFPKFGKVWFHLLVMSLLSASLPFTLFSYGETMISSALAGIINGITPVITVVLAHFLIPTEGMTKTKLVGVLSAVAGFTLILLPTLSDGSIDGDTLGMLMAGGAALSYSLGMIYGKRFLPKLPPLVAPATQLLLATCYMLPISLLCDFSAWTVMPSMVAIGSVVGLGLFGTALAFIFYFRILEHSGASVLSMATYLLPVYSTFFGVTFLEESLNWTVYLAAFFIILGMMIVNGTVSVFARKKAIKI